MHEYSDVRNRTVTGKPSFSATLGGADVAEARLTAVIGGKQTLAFG